MYNSSLNIFDNEKQTIGLSSPDFKPVDYPTMDEPIGNEMLKSSDRLKQEKNEFHYYSLKFRTMF